MAEDKNNNRESRTNSSRFIESRRDLFNEGVEKGGISKEQLEHLIKISEDKKK